MATDPEHSVVNPDLRVRTVDNLYVAGGSAFPTGGCANPTMTIVAPSIRLAELVRSENLITVAPFSARSGGARFQQHVAGFQRRSKAVAHFFAQSP
jgi:choline dehydrogenase-like flavoprotein